MTEIVAWHTSALRTLVIRPGLHVGTIEQARMRGARHLHRIVMDVNGRIPRMRDRGSWNAKTLQHHARSALVAVYLNRHEGVPIEEFDRARRSIELDLVPDSVFRRFVPSAADSWIILDPSVVRTVELVDNPGT